jgi:hypothetical protein
MSRRSTPSAATATPRQVQAGIGVVPSHQVQSTPVGAFVNSGAHFVWLHTHAADGIIHVESPSAGVYTLGDFLDSWRDQLGSNHAGPAQRAALETAKIRPVRSVTLLSPAGLWRRNTPVYCRVSLRLSRWLARRAERLLSHLGALSPSARSDPRPESRPPDPDLHSTGTRRHPRDGQQHRLRGDPAGDPCHAATSRDTR